MALAAGFLLLFALGAVLAAVFFLQPKNQVLFAVANTFKNSDWAKEIPKSEFLDAEGISFYGSWNTGTVNGDLGMQFGSEETGISLSAGVFGASVGGDGILMGDEIRMKIPMAGDVIYIHQLKEETPFFDELLGKRKAQAIDTALLALSSIHWKKPNNGETDAQEMIRQLKEAKVKRGTSKEYEIDGQNVSCKGYCVDTSNLPWLKEQGLDIEETWVYVYRFQLAAIALKSRDGNMEIRFLGGDNRDSEIMFVKEHEFSVSVKGEREEDFAIKVIYENEEKTRVAFRGTLAEDSIKAVIRSAAVRGKDSKLEGEVEIVPGAEIEDLEGEEMDLESLPDGKKQMFLTIFRLFRLN